MSRPDWTIAVDWGTTSLRAWLLDPQGAITAQATRPDGVMAVRDGRFSEILQETIGAWRSRHSSAPVIACGMVGSRQGWREAPYVPCPCGAAELAAAVLRVEAPGLGPVAIVPGVSCIDEAGIPDVMRGEETQVVGILEPDAGGQRLVVLPGTHSKWVRVEDGRIASFATFMTGELFAVLVSHSILGRLMAGEAEDAGAFADGVARGASDGIERRLFSVRTLGLFDRLPPSAARAYLSGLLIGGEIAAAEAMLPAGRERRVSVVGAEALVRQYAAALALRGWLVDPVGEAGTRHGLRRIAALVREART